MFVGIDAPDFNLGVEKRLKAKAIPVIHYVSPNRLGLAARSGSRLFQSPPTASCVFSRLSPTTLRNTRLSPDYTGHPMADEIPLQRSSESARSGLGIEASGTYVALLPGSRLSEVEKLSAAMLDAAEILTRQRPEIRFLMPAATEVISQYFKSELRRYPDINCQVYLNHSKDVMTASDVVICASGTAALEGMLVNRPMVVCYRLAGMTYRLAKWFKLVKSRFISLPNILSSSALVPELLQDDVTGERIAKEVSRWLDQPLLRENLEQRFEQLHRQLRIDAAASAAKVVLQHTSGPSENF